VPGAPTYLQIIIYLRATTFQGLDSGDRRSHPVRIPSRRSTENEPLQNVRHLLCRPGGEVRIMPHRRLLWGVLEGLSDVEQRHPRRNEETGENTPQVVDPDTTDPKAADRVAFSARRTAAYEADSERNPASRSVCANRRAVFLMTHCSRSGRSPACLNSAANRRGDPHSVLPA
jgi:hypothetical protein